MHRNFFYESIEVKIEVEVEIIAVDRKPYYLTKIKQTKLERFNPVSDKLDSLKNMKVFTCIEEMKRGTCLRLGKILCMRESSRKEGM